MILTGSNLVAAARKIAEEAHRGQTRADKRTPYLNHPLDVADRFCKKWATEMGGISGLLCRGEALALVHDVLEDSDFTIEQLSDLGLESIITELRPLTNEDGLTYLDYLLRLRHSNNQLALAVKLCDMDSNLADLHNILSAGRRKAMETKYSLARYILTHP